MRLFSYKLTHDTGFAPNPFWGFLTVATCKPGFRRTKCPGDWIAGFTSGQLCGDKVGEEQLIYLMKLNERIAIANYFHDPRFQRKIPDISAQKEIYLAGDNIYKPLCPHPTNVNDFEQLPNPHHGENTKEHDILGDNVLIGTEFIYFGRNALSIPPHLRPDVPKGQSGYGAETCDTKRTQDFIKFVMQKTSAGRIQGVPHGWPEGDESWRETP